MGSRLILEVERVCDYPMGMLKMIDGKNYEVCEGEVDRDDEEHPHAGRIWLTPRLDLDCDQLRADLARVTSERDEAVSVMRTTAENAAKIAADNARLREAVESIILEWDYNLGSRIKYFGSDIQMDLVVDGNSMQNTIYAAEAAIKEDK